MCLLQLSTLTGLVELCLCDGVIDSRCQLAALSRLERLSIQDVLPASLPLLSSITDLSVEGLWSDEEEARHLPVLCQALQQLTGIRHLNFVLDHQGQALQHLTSLTQLQSLICWAPHGVGASLPTGRWLAGVGEMTLSATIAAASLDALSAAHCLHTLRLTDCEEVSLRQQLKLLKWAERHVLVHPALCTLHMNYGLHADPDSVEQAMPNKIVAAVERVRMRRPFLRIEL